MIRSFLILAFLGTLNLAQAAPYIEESDKIGFEIGDSSTSSSGWCLWFPLFDWIDESWSVQMPEGMSRKTSIWFCDTAQIEADSALEFLKVFETRYQGCLDIEVNARPDVKQITVKKGPRLVHGRQSETMRYYVNTPDGDVEVASKSYTGQINYMCAHDISNAPDKEHGHYKIMKAGLEGLSE